MLKETPLPTTVRPRRYQKLSERLRQFMAENHFRDGDKLPPERALAESFGVSRNSVREAIHALAERGLLESRHGDGTYVRVPDMEPLRSAILEAVDSEGHMFDEVMEYRRILEPAVAELAALRRTPEQLDRLKIIACDQQRRILIDGDDGETMSTAARTDPDRLSMTPAQEVRVMSRPTACAAVALRARS